MFKPPPFYILPTLFSLATVGLLSSCAGHPDSDSADTDSDSESNTVCVPARHSVDLVSLSQSQSKNCGIATAHVQHLLVDCNVQTTGEVLANSDLLTHVTAPITGRVVDITVSIGDHVASGERIATVRSSDVEQSEADLLQNEAQVKADLKRDLLQIDSDLNQAFEQLKLSTSTYSRIEALYNEKIAARADYENAKSQYQKDRITYDTDRRKRTMTIQLSNEKLKLATGPIKEKLRLLGVSDAELARVERTRAIDPEVPVVSPTEGIVSERLVNVGELVDPAKPLFTIGDFHNVWIKADIYEKDVSKVATGQPIELELDSFPGETFRGSINYVSDSINPDTRTLLVRASVPNPDLKLKPKMFARMTILTGKTDIVAVPASAVQEAGSKSVVYIPQPKGNFAERPVEVGRRYGNFVEIVSGVSAGENVVTNGSLALKGEAMRQD